jgi:ornithine carbamoyltransferase
MADILTVIEKRGTYEGLKVAWIGDGNNMANSWIEAAGKLGFDLTDAWATIYGTRPQIMVGATLPSLARVNRVLHSDDWSSLNNQLQDFVQNYQVKVVESQGGFQF